VPTSKSCDTKTRPNSKNPTRSNLDIVPSLRISGQLPAPIVNGRGDTFENNRISNFKARDLDLGSGHSAYRRASLIKLYLHAKFY